MLDLMKKLNDTLHGLDLESPVIEVHDLEGSLFGTVVSGSFTGVDEAERQSQIWGALLDALDDQERAAIEFVFTMAPGENEAQQEAV